MLLNAQKLSGENLPLHFIMNGGIDFYKKAAGKESTTGKLFSLISDLEPELVIFDSLTRCHSGNENSSQDMATVFHNVKVLTNKTSVLFTHHLRKGNGLDYGNAGQRIRGSSDIRAFVDYTLLIDKAPSGAKITHDKSRWSEPIKPFSIAFDFTEDTFDLLYEGERTDSYHDVWIWLQEKLEDGTLWRQELVELAKSEQICSQRTLDTVLTWRTKEGFLIKTTHGKQKQYELAAYPVTIYSEDEALL